MRRTVKVVRRAVSLLGLDGTCAHGNRVEVAPLELCHVRVAHAQRPRVPSHRSDRRPRVRDIGVGVGKVAMAGWGVPSRTLRATCNLCGGRGWLAGRAGGIL